MFFSLLVGILNIIAWILLASAGVLVARYFDSIYPEYDRYIVVDNNGVATGQKIQRRRRHATFFKVLHLINPLAFWCKSVLSSLGPSNNYDHRGGFNLACLFRNLV